MAAALHTALSGDLISQQGCVQACICRCVGQGSPPGIHAAHYLSTPTISFTTAALLHITGPVRSSHKKEERQQQRSGGPESLGKSRKKAHLLLLMTVGRPLRQAGKVAVTEPPCEEAHPPLLLSLAGS